MRLLACFAGGCRRGDRAGARGRARGQSLLLFLARRGLRPVSRNPPQFRFLAPLFTPQGELHRMPRQFARDQPAARRRTRAGPGARAGAPATRRCAANGGALPELPPGRVRPVEERAAQHHLRPHLHGPANTTATAPHGRLPALPRHALSRAASRTWWRRSNTTGPWRLKDAQADQRARHSVPGLPLHPPRGRAHVEARARHGGRSRRWCGLRCR